MNYLSSSFIVALVFHSIFLPSHTHAFTDCHNLLHNNISATNFEVYMSPFAYNNGNLELARVVVRTDFKNDCEGCKWCLQPGTSQQHNSNSLPLVHVMHFVATGESIFPLHLRVDYADTSRPLILILGATVRKLFYLDVHPVISASLSAKRNNSIKHTIILAGAHSLLSFEQWGASQWFQVQYKPNLFSAFLYAASTQQSTSAAISALNELYSPEGDGVLRSPILEPVTSVTVMTGDIHQIHLRPWTEALNVYLANRAGRPTWECDSEAVRSVASSMQEGFSLHMNANQRAQCSLRPKFPTGASSSSPRNMLYLNFDKVHLKGNILMLELLSGPGDISRSTEEEELVLVLNGPPVLAGLSLNVESLRRRLVVQSLVDVQLLIGKEMKSLSSMKSMVHVQMHSNKTVLQEYITNTYFSSNKSEWNMHMYTVHLPRIQSSSEVPSPLPQPVSTQDIQTSLDSHADSVKIILHFDEWSYKWWNLVPQPTYMECSASLQDLLLKVDLSSVPKHYNSYRYGLFWPPDNLTVSVGGLEITGRRGCDLVPLSSLNNSTHFNSFWMMMEALTVPWDPVTACGWSWVKPLPVEEFDPVTSIVVFQSGSEKYYQMFHCPTMSTGKRVSREVFLNMQMHVRTNDTLRKYPLHHNTTTNTNNNNNNTEAMHPLQMFHLSGNLTDSEEEIRGPIYTLMHVEGTQNESIDFAVQACEVEYFLSLQTSSLSASDVPPVSTYLLGSQPLSWTSSNPCRVWSPSDMKSNAKQISRGFLWWLGPSWPERVRRVLQSAKPLLHSADWCPGCFHLPPHVVNQTHFAGKIEDSRSVFNLTVHLHCRITPCLRTLNHQRIIIDEAHIALSRSLQRCVHDERQSVCEMLQTSSKSSNAASVVHVFSGGVVLSLHSTRSGWCEGPHCWLILVLVILVGLLLALLLVVFLSWTVSHKLRTHTATPTPTASSSSPHADLNSASNTSSCCYWFTLPWRPTTEQEDPEMSMRLMRIIKNRPPSPPAPTTTSNMDGGGMLNHRPFSYHQDGSDAPPPNVNCDGSPLRPLLMDEVVVTDPQLSRMQTSAQVML